MIGVRWVGVPDYVDCRNDRVGCAKSMGALVPRRRVWFGVSKMERLNRSRVRLPICPYYGVFGPNFPEILRSHYCHR